MDALYLKENINNAISEALTSMVVQSPDDPIEYLGSYLLNYVDRHIEKKEVRSFMQYFVVSSVYRFHIRFHTCPLRLRSLQTLLSFIHLTSLRSFFVHVDIHSYRKRQLPTRQ